MQSLSSIDPQKVKKEAGQHPNLPQVLHHTSAGWDVEKQPDSALSRYYMLGEERSSVDDLLLRGEVLVLFALPLRLAYESHPGIMRTK